MIHSHCLLVSSQRPHVHLFRLRHLALVGAEPAEVIDRLQCRRVFGSPRLFLSSQRPYVHLFRLRHLALVGAEQAEIIYRGQK